MSNAASEHNPFAADRRRLYAAASVRAVGAGMTGPLLGMHLATANYEHGFLGLVVGTGLAGAALAAGVVTYGGDRWGRRATAAMLCVLTGLGGMAVAYGGESWWVLVAAFLGMLNGMGKDRGAVPVLESSMLPHTTDDAGRTSVFARYALAQDIGHGVGAACIAIPGALVVLLGMGNASATAWALGMAGVLALIAAPLYLRLSPGLEIHTRTTPAPPISPQGQRTIVKLSALFSLDAIGGGFLTGAAMSYIFTEVFHASALTVALLFVGARILNGVSHLAAAWLAKRIGLINTMVFTHIPSSFLLMTVAIAPNIEIAAILFLLREGLVEMDVPTRQSYVMAVVQAHERTTAAGVTALVRMAGWSVGAFLAAPLVTSAGVTAPLVAGAGLKIIYDLALWSACRRVKPPEERS